MFPVASCWGSWANRLDKSEYFKYSFDYSKLRSREATHLLRGFAMRGLFLSLIFSLILSIPVRGDDVVGAIWKIDFKDDKSSFKLQCTKNGKVFGLAGKKIGTWKGDGPQSELDITDWGKRNGVYTITKLKKDPPAYRGIYKNSRGEGTLITVTLVKD